MPLSEKASHSKERSTDRVLVLKPIDGLGTISSLGLVDNRLFTGENKLHAVKDKAVNIWSMRYEAGAVPEPLKQKFTTFPALYNFADNYFKKRNIRIVEVID